jgi:IQ calmodulin-binding motif
MLMISFASAMQATHAQRGYAGLDEADRCNKAATSLQKVYRGHRIRKHMPALLQAMRSHKRWVPSTIFRMFCALQVSLDAALQV